MNGSFVGEGVNVGVEVEVRVMVCESVTVALGEGVGLCVGVSVNTMTSVWVGTTLVGLCVAVGVGRRGGVKKKLEISASRRRMPIIIGKPYLRSNNGRVSAGTTGSPT